MQKGGWVMWPLLSLSVFSLGITIERVLFWSRVSGLAAKIRVGRLVEALRLGRRDDVVKMCEHSSQPEMMVALRLALDGARGVHAVGAEGGEGRGRGEQAR